MGRKDDLVVTNEKRTLQNSRQLPDCRLELVSFIGQEARYYRELIAANASHQFSRSAEVLKPRCNLAEQQIADFDTEHTVESAEPLQVQDKECDLATGCGQCFS